MTPASFTEQMYLCLAISVLVLLYVFLLALDSPWSNHGVASCYKIAAFRFSQKDKILPLMIQRQYLNIY
ncbi:hypothetical protein SESBI_11623 [Sesbania bispinosa]|nr:hypothetical protein SESBI_11623 [Sesbania bispinosa]